MLQKLQFDFSKNINDGSVTAHYEEKENYHYLMTVPTHPMWQGIDKEPVCVFFVKEVEPGIYESDLNFEHDIDFYTDFKAYDSYDRLSKKGIPMSWNHEGGVSMSDYFEQTIEPYGVADNIEQIKEHYKELISSSNPIVISVSEINKDYQPEEGGWRWHKWGKYIGTQNPQAEYIKDEPEIQSVYVFHVYAVQSKELTKKMKP